MCVCERERRTETEKQIHLKEYHSSTYTRSASGEFRRFSCVRWWTVLQPRRRGRGEMEGGGGVWGHKGDRGRPESRASEVAEAETISTCNGAWNRERWLIILRRANFARKVLDAEVMETFPSGVFQLWLKPNPDRTVPNESGAVRTPDLSLPGWESCACMFAPLFTVEADFRAKAKLQICQASRHIWRARLVSTEIPRLFVHCAKAEG